MKRTRPVSRPAKEALLLLGRSILARRLERRMTAHEAAERIGVSRPLLHRIESGDPGCSIGVVFEAAAVLGVPLFESDRTGGSLAGALGQTEHTLALLPKAARPLKGPVFDDF